MRILFFLPSLSGGGAERVVFNLIQGLVDCNVEVCLIVTSQDGIWYKQLPKLCSVVNLNTSRVFKSFIPLIKQIREREPDILFSAIDNANIVNVLACKMSGKKVKSMISVHQVSSEFRKLHNTKKEKLLNCITNIVFPFTDKMVVVSEAIKADVLQNIDIAEDKIVTIGNPIINVTDIINFPILKKQRPTIPIIVAFGRLAIEKDFVTLIRAFHLYLQEQQAKLIIYGEGPERESLERLCFELNIEKHVSMPGFVDDVFGKMSQADLCVISSITEGFGNVIVEALTCGVPVVSTDCGGPTEILQDGKYGTLVPIGDVKQMVKAIRTVLSQKNNTEVLQQRARDFTIEHITTKYINVFNTLIDRGDV